MFLLSPKCAAATAESVSRYYCVFAEPVPRLQQIISPDIEAAALLRENDESSEEDQEKQREEQAKTCQGLQEQPPYEVRRQLLCHSSSAREWWVRQLSKELPSSSAPHPTANHHVDGRLVRSPKRSQRQDPPLVCGLELALPLRRGGLHGRLGLIIWPSPLLDSVQDAHGDTALIDGASARSRRSAR